MPPSPMGRGMDIVDILLAVVLALATIRLTYMGVQVNPKEKVVFFVIAAAILILIGWQAYRSSQSQDVMHTQISTIEQNTKQPPTVQVTPQINVPPAQIIFPPLTVEPKTIVDLRQQLNQRSIEIQELRQLKDKAEEAASRSASDNAALNNQLRDLQGKLTDKVDRQIHREKIADILIRKYPGTDPALERLPKLFVQEWLNVIHRVNEGMTKHDLQTVLKIRPRLRDYISDGAHLAEAIFTLHGLQSEGYMHITETSERIMGYPRVVNNIEFEFVPEKLNEFKEGL
jgi:hypothetical protein